MLAYANPARFMTLATILQPWVGTATVVLLTTGLYLALFVAPPDYQQGEAVRLMFVHVPSAWMAMGVYLFIGMMSAVSFVFKRPLADVAARAAAPIGACFTFLALATGSLWGKPMWGAWWVWDARLTSVLLLFFLYLGYIALWRTIDNPLLASRAAAILAMVGVLNLPIIHYSVEWWNTLHQPASVLRAEGPAIHSSLLIPLLVMALAFASFFVSVLIMRMRSEIMQRRLHTLLTTYANRPTQEYTP
ncbi:MAG: heme ABC transporter permease [Parvularculales bacterium]